MQCKFTASTTITPKYTTATSRSNHVSSTSALPSLLSNYRVKSYPSAKTHHVISFPLHRRRFGKFPSNSNGGNTEVCEDDQAQPMPKRQEEQDDDDGDDELPELLQLGNSAILPACFVGLFTGIAIVLFNYTVTNT